jgi:phage terminase large subunit-like protein
MDAADAPVVIKPQKGPQETFLSSPADIAIYGGAAGGGKTWALLLEPLRHVHNGEFGAVFFRRTTVQVRNEGGLWDESMKLYPLLGASPKEHVLSWDFPSGATISFAHLEHDKTVLNWQGAQIALICFDELTHFSESQFWYMVSRNRSMSGVRPYIRATCNPDVDSWVAGFVSWWIDQETGLAIPERAGVLRWFVRVNNTLFWADTADELRERFPETSPKSATFIPARLSDNAALMAADPGYLANLMALPQVERERLLGGNWKVRAIAGLFFKREWFKRYRPGDEPNALRVYLTSDHAPTESEDNDPTACRVWGVDPNGDVWMLGGFNHHATMDVTADRIVGNAKDQYREADRPIYQGLIRQFEPFAWFPEDDNNWKTAAPFIKRRMREEDVRCIIAPISPHGHDKAAKAQGAQGMAAMGRVWIPLGSEGDAIIDELDAFSAAAEHAHDEEVDCLAIMCRAIDMAHPAIVEPEKPKDEGIRGINAMTFNEAVEQYLQPKAERV